MKLRRAIAATATVAALAAPVPLTLLSVSAPTAFASTASGGTDTAAGGTDQTAGATPTPAASDETPLSASGTATPSATATDPSTPQTPTPTGSPTPSGSASTEPPAGATQPPSGTVPKPGSSPTLDIDRDHDATSDEPQDTGDGTGEGDGSGGQDEGKNSKPPLPGDGWSPSQCKEFVPDDRLSVDVSGLPSKIVAGSGWHPFTFAVTNHSGAPLRNLYVQSFTEYTTGVNEQASLQSSLAQLQFHDPATGRWTDAFQDSYQDGTGRHPYTGTFVARIPSLATGHRVDLLLRVRVATRAPAGAAFALSTAVYAGHGSSCNINGDTYDFTVLKAGSHLGNVDDARPTGEKPMDGHGNGTHPQGATQIVPVTGAMADTGTSEAVPIMGVIGACAVLLGALLVFASRRRAIALAHAQDADVAEPMGDTEDPAAAEAPEDAADQGDTTGAESSTTDETATTTPPGTTDPADPADPADTTATSDSAEATEATEATAATEATKATKATEASDATATADGDTAPRPDGSPKPQGPEDISGNSDTA